MVRVIDAHTPVDAWLQGARALLGTGAHYNLVTQISNPTTFDDQWLTTLNARSVRPDARPSREVEHTIFPRLLHQRSSTRQALYDAYVRRHEQYMKRRSRRVWGAYFDRLIRFGPNETNQLETIIAALCRWKQRVPRAGLVMHTSSADTDSLIKHRGNPCLQYVEVVCPQPHEVGLVAVYRNHEFFERAFPNFLGLGHLLQFIATETNKNPEKLVCHSVHAFNGFRKKDLEKLVANAERCF